MSSFRRFLQTFRLADRGRRLFVPGRASRLGHHGHLLFEFAVGRRAHWVGGRLRGVRNLGALVLPPT